MIHPTVSSQSSQTGEHLSQTSNGKTGKLRKKIQKISDSQITVPVQKKSSDQHLNAKNKNGRGKKTPNGHSNHQLPPVETAFDYKALEKTQFADEWVAKFSYYLFNDKDSEFGKLLAEGKALIEEHCNTYPNEAFYVLLHLIKSDQMTLPESILLFSKICESKNQNIDQDIVEELCIEFCLKMKNGTQKAGTSEQNGSLKQRIAIITFLKVHNIKNSDEINNLLLDKCVTEEFLKINKTKETPRAKNSSLQTFEQLTEEHKGKDPDLWIATLKSNLSNKNFDQFLKIHADNPSFAAQVFESFFMERIKTLTEKSNSIAIKDLIVLRLKVIERLPESFNPSTIQSVDIPLIEFSQTKDRDAYFSGWSLFEKIIKQKIEHNTSINIEIVLNTFFHHGINRKDSLKSELTKKTSNFINNYLDKFHHTIHLNSFIDIAKNKLQIKNVDTIARKENIQLEQMIYLALKPVINPSETISDSESEFLWFQIPLQMSASEEKRAIEYFELVYKKIYSKFSQDEASNYRLFLYLYQKTDAYLKTACSDNIKAALIDLLVLEYPLAHRFPQEAKDKLLSLTLSKEIIWKISLYLCEDIDVKNLTKKDRARIRKILKNLINEIFQKPFSYLKINKFFTILQKFHSLSSEFGSLFENTVKQILRYFKNNPIKINESEAIVGLLSNLELIVGCRNIIFEEFKNSQIEDQKRLQLDSTISLFQLLDMAKIIDSNEIFLSHTRNILDSLIHFHKTQIAHSRDINGDLRLCTTLLGILINRAPGLANSDQNEIRKYSRNEICEYSKIILDLIQHISDSNFKVEEDSILCRLYSTPSILSQLFDGYETREELNKTYELLKKICHPITSNTSTNRSQHPTLSSILEDLSKAEILQHDVILKFYTSFLPKAENLIKKSAITLFFEKILPQEILSQGSFLQQMWTPLIDFSNDFDHFSLILSYLPLIDQYSNLCDNHAKFESFYELLAKKIEFFCSQELKPDSQKIILSAISKLFNLFCDGKIAIKLQPLFMAILNKSISSQDINNILRPIQPTSEAKFIAKKHILDMALFVKKINKRNYQLKMESLWQNYFNLKFRKPISNVPVECFTQFYQHLGASEIVDGLCVFFKFIMKNSDATHLSVNLNQIWELVEEINNKHTQHGFLILEFIKGTLKNFKNYPLSFQNFVLEKVQSYFDKKESNLNNLGFHFSLILAFLVIHPRNESFELPQLVQKFIDEWLALFNETYNFEKVCPDAYWCFNFLNDQKQLEKQLENPFNSEMKQGYFLTMQRLLSNSNGNIDQILYALSFLKYRKEVFHEYSFRETFEIFQSFLSAISLSLKNKKIDSDKLVQILDVLKEYIFEAFKEQQASSISFVSHFQNVLGNYLQLIIKIEKKQILDKTYTSKLLYDLFQLNTFHSTNDLQNDLFKRINKTIIDYIYDKEENNEFLLKFIKNIYDSKQSCDEIEKLDSLLSKMKYSSSDVESAKRQVSEIAQRNLVKYPFTFETEELNFLLSKRKSHQSKDLVSSHDRAIIELSKSRNPEAVIKSLEMMIEIWKKIQNTTQEKKITINPIIIQTLLNGITNLSPTDRSKEFFNKFKDLFWDLLNGCHFIIVDETEKYKWLKFWNAILSNEIYPNDLELFDTLTENFSFFKRLFETSDCYHEKTFFLENVLQKLLNTKCDPQNTPQEHFTCFLKWIKFILYKLDDDGGISDSVRMRLSPLVLQISDRLVKNLKDGIDVSKAKNAITFLKSCKALNISIDEELKNIKWKKITSYLIQQKISFVDQELEPVKKSTMEKNAFKYCCDLMDLTEFAGTSAQILRFMHERSGSHSIQMFYEFQTWMKNYLSAKKFDFSGFEESNLLNFLICDSRKAMRSKYPLSIIDNLIYYYKNWIKNPDFDDEIKINNIHSFITEALNLPRAQLTKTLDLLKFFYISKESLDYSKYPKKYYSLYYTFASLPIPELNFNDQLLNFTPLKDDGKTHLEVLNEYFDEYTSDLDSDKLKQVCHILWFANKCCTDEAVQKRSLALFSELIIKIKNLSLPNLKKDRSLDLIYIFLFIEAYPLLAFTFEGEARTKLISELIDAMLKTYEQHPEFYIDKIIDDAITILHDALNKGWIEKEFVGFFHKIAMIVGKLPKIKTKEILDIRKKFEALKEKIKEVYPSWLVK